MSDGTDLTVLIIGYFLFCRPCDQVTDSFRIWMLLLKIDNLSAFYTFKLFHSFSVPSQNNGDQKEQKFDWCCNNPTTEHNTKI